MVSRDLGVRLVRWDREACLETLAVQDHRDREVTLAYRDHKAARGLKVLLEPWANQDHKVTVVTVAQQAL